MNQNRKNSQKIYFFRLLHAFLAHQKLLIKNKRVFCLWMKVSISRYFHAFERLKTVCQSCSVEVFGYLICGSMRQKKQSYISKSEKHLETRLHSVCALNSRSCCQRTTLPSDIKNSARFLQFHFTHCPPYHNDKTILGTRRTSKEVVL